MGAPEGFIGVLGLSDGVSASQGLQVKLSHRSFRDSMKAQDSVSKARN